MYVTIVYVHVKPERVRDFVEASRLNHEAAVNEPGNLRFDVLQSAEDPTRFVLYEAYRDEAASKAHKETAHYLVWRDAVADWMAEPRKGVPYEGRFPVDARKDAPADVRNDTEAGAENDTAAGARNEPAAQPTASRTAGSRL